MAGLALKAAKARPPASDGVPAMTGPPNPEKGAGPRKAPTPPLIKETLTVTIRSQPID